MTPDATDLILIFAFVICVIVLAGISAIHTAYRAGYMHGRRQGVLWEKRRRRRVEERVEAAIEKTFNSSDWAKELDV
jgi:hypothetical protein